MNSVGSLPLNGFPTGEPLPAGSGASDGSRNADAPGFESFLERRPVREFSRSGKQPAAPSHDGRSAPTGKAPVPASQPETPMNGDPNAATVRGVDENPTAPLSAEAPDADLQDAPVETPQSAIHPQAAVAVALPSRISLPSPVSTPGSIFDPLAQSPWETPQVPDTTAADADALQTPELPAIPDSQVDNASSMPLDWIASSLATPQWQPRLVAAQPAEPSQAPSDSSAAVSVPAETVPALSKPEPAPIPTGKTVPPQKGAAKIAGNPVAGEQPLNTPQPTPEKTAAFKQVPSADGMSVAMQHPSMPPTRPQLPKTEPIALAEASSQPQSAIAEIARPVAPVSAGQEPNNSGDETQDFGDGSQAFDLSALTSVPRENTPATPSAVRSETVQDTGATLFHHISDAMERMRSNGQNNIEIRVQLHDGQEVTIQLKMSAGEFQPVFKTESAELRTALEQNWSQFSSNSVDRGFKIAAPVFETSQSGLGDFQQRHDRPQQQESPVIATEEFRRPTQSKPRAAVAASPSKSSGALDLFA